MKRQLIHWRNILLHSLKSQLIFSFMLMSLIILSISYFFIYLYILDLLQKRTEESTIQTFQQTESSIDTFSEEMDKITKRFLLEDQLAKFIDNDISSETEEIERIKGISNLTASLFGDYVYIHSVYIFKDNREILGFTGNRNFYIKAGENHPFYRSKTFIQTRKNYPRVVWTGGNRSKEFDMPFDSLEPTEEIVSISRNLKPTYRGAPSGMLVVNIKEMKVMDFFNRLSNPKKSKIFIIDRDGVIISSADKSELREKYNSINRLDPNQTFGSFAGRENGIQVQTIYRRIGGMGWVLVKEVPMSEYLKDALLLRFLILIMFALSLFLALLLSSFWIRRIVKPIREMLKAMRHVSQGRQGSVEAIHPHNELGMLSRQFNQLSHNVVTLIEKNQRIEEEKRKLEILTLQTQINPHFIYNTLNTIKWMAIINKTMNVAQCITALGNILKPLFKDVSIFQLMSDEITLSENYIQIMNARIGEAVKVTFSIEADLYDALVPRFILQPLIENCFEHGSKDKVQLSTIHIVAMRVQDDLLLTVTDNGKGIESKRLDDVRAAIYHHGTKEEDHGIGLYNVNQRIVLNYGEQYGLMLDSSLGEGTVVRIKMPIKYKSSENT